ncbi:MAG: glycine--tRNA ligase, partial [Candidatus Omnitrophota bacterium]
MEKIVSLCKRRGFIFQSSEIYGGLASVWDYGPLGVELKNNLKQAWWRANVYRRSDIEGLDAAILMSSRVWQASGHIDNFSDQLIDCKGCKKRYKAEDLKDNAVCPNCGGRDLTAPRAFNLMFRLPLNVIEGGQDFLFLRPETARGIFVNFLNVLDSRHRRIP